MKVTYEYMMTLSDRILKNQIFKKDGLDGIPFFRGGCWERGGWLFSGEFCSFYIKNKLKSEIFNDKKGL